MHHQTGNMREISHDISPMKDSWERDNEFHYPQRTKYQKSQISYHQSQTSNIYYDEQRTDRFKIIQSKELVEKVIPIKIKSNEREDISSILRIQLSTSSSKGSSLYTIRITDDKDSLFLWIFNVNQSGFPTLKKEQCLKIDFQGFPQLMDKYLNDVKGEMNCQEEKTFTAVLKVKNEEAQFKLLELNKYKESEHLTLKFKKANDEQVKVYLGQKYDEKCEQNKSFMKRISSLETALGERKKQLQVLRVQLQSRNKQYEYQSEQFEKDKKDQIYNLKEQLREKYEKQDKRKEETNRQKIQSLNKDIEKQKIKNQELDRKYEKLRESNEELLKKERELSMNLNIMQSQKNLFEKECEQQKKIIEPLNIKKMDLQKQNAAMEVKIESLESQLLNKETIIKQNYEAKTSNYDKVDMLETLLKEEKSKVKKLEEKIQRIEEECRNQKKANENLNKKINKKKQKIVEIQETTKKIYEDIKKKDKQIEDLNQQSRESKRGKDYLEEEIKDREIKLRDSKGRLEQSQKVVEEQKKMIEYLNKQMNEKAVGIRPFPNSGSYSPSPSYASTVSNFPSSSESRLKYSNPVNSMQRIEKQKGQRIVPPPIKRYGGGIQNNDFNKQKKQKDRQRSKSPMVGRLNQQQDPQEEMQKNNKERIQPIKFKK